MILIMGCQSNDNQQGNVIDDETANEVVATVNGENIIRKELEEAVSRMITAGQEAGDIPGGEVEEATLKEYREVAMDELVKQKILYQEGIAAGFVATDEMVEEQLGLIKEQLPQEGAYEEALARMGLTEEGLIKMLEIEIVIDQYLNADFDENISVTNDEIVELYNKYRDEVTAQAGTTEGTDFPALDAEISAYLENEIRRDIKEPVRFEEIMEALLEKSDVQINI